MTGCSGRDEERIGQPAEMARPGTDRPVRRDGTVKRIGASRTAPETGRTRYLVRLMAPGLSYPCFLSFHPQGPDPSP